MECGATTALGLFSIGASVLGLLSLRAHPYEVSAGIGECCRTPELEPRAVAPEDVGTLELNYLMLAPPNP